MLKTRVWSPNLKRYIYNVAVEPITDGFIISGTVDSDPVIELFTRTKRFELEFNTYLKDQLGNTIFEGDIVSNWGKMYTVQTIKGRTVIIGDDDIIIGEDGIANSRLYKNKEGRNKKQERIEKLLKNLDETLEELFDEEVRSVCFEAAAIMEKYVILDADWDLNL